MQWCRKLEARTALHSTFNVRTLSNSGYNVITVIIIITENEKKETSLNGQKIKTKILRFKLKPQQFNSIPIQFCC